MIGSIFSFLRYHVNPIGIGYYTQEIDYNPFSFLKHCQYAGKIAKFNGSRSNFATCDMFQPALTDLGICKSFNINPMVEALQQSRFKGL